MDVLQFKTAIWNLQRSIAENANALFSSVAAQNGLTPQQAALLLELAQKGPCRMGDLARTLCLTKTNATPLCKHLEEAGYPPPGRNRRAGGLGHLIPPGEEGSHPAGNRL